MPPPELELLERAARLALASVEAGGGPFGAVVARADGEVLGEGANRVVPAADPTAHAEIEAIRAACRRLGSHDLSGAVLFTSCEPCPMCLGATWWARIERVVYSLGRADAAAIGFDDARLYEELSLPLASRALPLVQRDCRTAREAFRAWRAKPDRHPY